MQCPQELLPQRAVPAGAVSAKCLGHFVCIIQSNRATGTADQIALNHVGCDHYKQKYPNIVKVFLFLIFFTFVELKCCTFKN